MRSGAHRLKPALQRRRILVIDAEAESRGQLRALLTHAGFQVTLAASGYEGLEQVAAQWRNDPTQLRA